MKPTRQRLLDYLATHPPITAAGLARALQVTPADARHHLAILRREGLVVPVGTAPPDGRGRPAQRYRLATPRSEPGLQPLVEALLSEALDSLDPHAQEAALRRLATRLAGDSIRLEGNLARRLVRAVERLDQLGYHARWEARAVGPRLILERRPFANLEAPHPELARLEAYLIEVLLGVSLSRIEIFQSPSILESSVAYQVLLQADPIDKQIRS